MNWKLQRDIFIAFFRSGILGYGGGPSTIPLVHKEVVVRYEWMTNEEFSDVLAIGNALPGPIATKMAGYIGYRIGGFVGMMNGIIATVIPTVFIMIGLIGLLSSFRDSPIVIGMIQAVTPVIGVMLAALMYQFLKQSRASLGWIISIVLGVFSLIFYYFLGVHPAILIGILLLYGLLIPKRKKQPKSSKGESL
jgi:chromate transporter